MVSKHVKKFVTSIVTKYEDVSNFDKIYQAQTNVEQVQLMMEDNMKKMLNNHTNIQVGIFYKIFRLSLLCFYFWRRIKMLFIVIFDSIKLGVGQDKPRDEE